jgi:hypothetical protein
MTGIVVLVVLIWTWIEYEINNAPTIETDDQFADGMERDEYGNPILKD